jgi:hypothetical protein
VEASALRGKSVLIHKEGEAREVEI